MDRETDIEGERKEEVTPETIGQDRGRKRRELAIDAEKKDI